MSVKNKGPANRTPVTCGLWPVAPCYCTTFGVLFPAFFT